MDVNLAPEVAVAVGGVPASGGILPSAATIGVSDGTRTRDILDHNQGLYQLSYTHQWRRWPVDVGAA